MLADIDVINDRDSKKTYLAVTNVGDKYLSGENSSISNPVMNLLSNKYALENLPSEDDLNKVLVKYIKLALDNIENVKKSSEVTKLDGIEQKLTVLEFDFTRGNALKIIKAVLNSCKDDKDIKEIIADIEKAASTANGGQQLNLYDEFKSYVDTALSQIDSIEYEKNASILVWKDYVNSNHEIVGRNINVMGRQLINYIKLRDGKNFAANLDFDALNISGNGTESKNKLNGEYTLKVSNTELATMKIDDFNTNLFEDEKINGSITVTPNVANISSLTGEDSVEAIAGFIANIALMLDAKTDKNRGNLSINILTGDKVFAGIDLSASSRDGAIVTIPSEDKVISSDNISDWVSSLDLAKIDDALKRSGIPTELFSGLLGLG